MITVVKGSSKVVCTKGTFEEQLKPLGYRLASEVKEAVRSTASLLDKKEENKEQEDLSEKFGLKSSKISISKKGKK